MNPPEFISTEPCEVHLIEVSPVPASPIDGAQQAVTPDDGAGHQVGQGSYHRLLTVAERKVAT